MAPDVISLLYKLNWQCYSSEPMWKQMSLCRKTI